ncbi:porin [Ferruginibacter sp.]|nr:porin [Ferruginibacter sp.]
MKTTVKLICGALLISANGVFAQHDSSKITAQNNPLTFSGYGEIYYQYDLNKPADNNRPGFIYSHNRHNEFNLNLGFLKATYNTDKVRANIALAAGTYMNANYATETGVMKNVYEANAGIKLGKKNLWLDAGIFPSHIGFESAISKDCWALTRSILADNSPYYEAGAKLTYTTNNGKWLLSALALNGWQRIKRVDGNSMMSWGTQLQYKPSGKVILSYSSFIGTDKPDSVRQLRHFHNLYGIFNLTDKIALTAGVDIGAEQKAKKSKTFNTWFAPVLILKLQTGSKSNIAARVEYYNDKNGVIIFSNTSNGFKTWGASLNYDHAVAANMLWRIEGRMLSAKDRIFIKDSKPVNTDFFLTTSLAISL